MIAADEERARSWTPEIVETLREGVKWSREGNELRAVGSGGLGLFINTVHGCWHSHTAKTGSLSVIPLVMLLKSCFHTEAEAWVAAWLASHPGRGARITGNDHDDAVIENAAIARAIRDKVAEPETQTATYIGQTRGIELTSFAGLPVRFLPHARTGEGAVVALLTALGRETGILLTYIDAYGQKSLVAPQRRRLDWEKAPGAVFELPAPDNATEFAADTIIAEGLEDSLSIYSLNLSCTVKGLPGIGALRHLQVKQGERIIVVRDGDEPGSPANKALIAGVDNLLLQNAVVRVAETPLGADANSILQKEGPDSLLALITASTLAQLSIEGEVIRLSRLERLAYAQTRKEEAKRLGLTTEILDAEVKQRRRGAGGDGAPEASPPKGIGHGLDLQDIEPWPEEVDGQSLLDELEATIRRFVVLNEQGIVVSVLWIIGTYVFNEFPIFPRLFATAPERGCGKTTLLDLLELLTPRAVKVENITTAALFRTIEAARPTMMLDEADTFVPHSEELRGVVDSGHKKNGAVIRLVEIAGQYVPHKFSTFAPMALAAIKRLPGTIEDRSLLVHMKRRRKDEEVESLYRANGITNVARKLVRWAADNGAELSIANPEMPDGIMNRTANNWHPMFAIADRIGGDWSKRARVAAVTLNSEGVTSIEIELLADIRAAFEASPTRISLSSDEIIAGLILLEDRPWAEIKNGRPLTKYGLAALLRPFHIRPGTIWLPNGTTPKGYKREQFKDAFERYLPPLLPSSEESTARSPGAAENKGKRADSESPGTNPPGGWQMTENSSNPAAPGDLADQNGDNAGGPRGEAASEAKSAVNGDARPNGQDQSDEAAMSGRKRRLSKLDREIIDYDAAHPDLSLDALRKKFGGRSKEAIAALLGRTL